MNSEATSIANSYKCCEMSYISYRSTLVSTSIRSVSTSNTGAVSNAYRCQLPCSLATLGRDVRAKSRDVTNGETTFECKEEPGKFPESQVPIDWTKIEPKPKIGVR